MKLIKFKSFLIAVTSAVIILAGCNSSTNPTNPIKPSPPDSLAASSRDSSSVTLKWKASPNQNDTNFLDYVLYISPGTIAPMSVNKASNPLILTGLTEGTVYTFQLKARTKDSLMSDLAAQVNWSPASRFVNTIHDVPIYIYAYTSALGSGLDLYDPSNNGPNVVTVTSGDVWNFGLDTRNQQVLVGSPTKISYSFPDPSSVPHVQMSSDYFEANSLDDIFDTQALDIDPSKFSEMTVDLNSLSASNNVVFILRLIEPGNTKYTYAKILIKHTPGGFLQGTGKDQYIECMVSYQKVAGVPYARKAH